jgi:hypothetical protein
MAKKVIAILAIVSIFSFAVAASNSKNSESLKSNPVDQNPIDIQSTISTSNTKLSNDEIPLSIPLMLNYQGKLTNPSGNPVPDSSYLITFRLFTVPSGGSAYWNENQSVQTNTGLFNCLLGSVTSIPYIPSDGNCYLEMQVNPNPAMTPRIRIVSAAYSYMARKADSANYASSAPLTRPITPPVYSTEIRDTTIISNKLKDGVITMPKINQSGAATGQVIKWTGTAWAPRNDSVGSAGTADNAWMRGTPDSILYTIRQLGIARGNSGNMLYGNERYTHINLGVTCTTGTAGQNYGYCTVSGGQDNNATNSFAAVGGGVSNNTSGWAASIQGGHLNTASNTITTVGGGGHNLASGFAATVAGGMDDTASGTSATIGGGEANKAIQTFSTISGGHYNNANGVLTVIAGGDSNQASNSYSIVSGGHSNLASGFGATVGGGEYDTASGHFSTIGGGSKNKTIGLWYQTISGGLMNTASGYNATIGGGKSNLASDSWTTISGGISNAASNPYTAIGGGYKNSANGRYATVAGGDSNTANNWFATVGGGAYNTASGIISSVGGGIANIASGTYSNIGGGYLNSTNGNCATVGGGAGDTALAHFSGVLSGHGNVAGNNINDTAAVIAGGRENWAHGKYSFIGGGYQNTVFGDYAAVCNGYKSRANGKYSFANGYMAYADHSGSFVWADSGIDFHSTTANQFRVRAKGGIDIVGNVSIRSVNSGYPIVLELGEGLDYAEGFNVLEKDKILPGMVLIIDTENPDKLKVSDKPYDKKVAGIAAGANGLGSGVRLGGNQFDCNVALAGRVYCYVDASKNGIEPGDLLTTSTTPGYAMKVTDHIRAQGSILGKAMQRLEKGQKGQILVLVTLQ